ncbi:hypothetical protein HOY82DRAFT_534759 [Tuber indicum]|nr:hypothetical protein HOY82DRAFT_534759 [Tuber indicum]
MAKRKAVLSESQPSPPGLQTGSGHSRSGLHEWVSELEGSEEIQLSEENVVDGEQGLDWEEQEREQQEEQELEEQEQELERMGVEEQREQEAEELGDLGADEWEGEVEEQEQAGEDEGEGEGEGEVEVEDEDEIEQPAIVKRLFG